MRRVLAVAMAFLMLMASLPLDAVASVLDHATTRRVISETMPDGSVFDYEYDAFGRVARCSSPQGSVFHGYDETTGRRVRTSTASGDVSYGYDELGCLAEVVVPRLGGRDLAEPRVTEYAYDGIGARAAVRHGNGVVTHYAYDELDSWQTDRHGLTTHTQLERLGNGVTRRTVARPDGTKSVTTSVNGRTAAIRMVNSDGTDGNLTTYSYDEFNRLTGTVETFGSTTVNTVSMTYDDAGNMLSQTINGQTTSFQYDAMGRQIRVTAPGNAVTNTSYWPTGEVRRVDGASYPVEYTYNGLGQKATMTTFMDARTPQTTI